MQQVRVYAPATIGNVGPGFDVLGLAITNLGDIVEARRKRGFGVEILKIEGEGGDQLPRETDRNTASIAALKVLERIGARGGVNLIIEKGIPFPSGLGSSAASAVAAGVAVNMLYGEPLACEEVLEACTEAEAAVSGGYFADNTGAALYGGCIVSIANGGRLKVVPLGSIPDITVIVATPDIPMPTAKSRAVLPEVVPMKDFVINMGNAANMVAAVLKKDVDLFGRSIDDRIVEPARRGLITGFDAVKKAALDRGALGCSIAGAGASVFAVAHRKAAVCKIGEDMKLAFKDNGVEAKIHVCNIDRKGARMLREKKR